MFDLRPAKLLVGMFVLNVRRFNVSRPPGTLAIEISIILGYSVPINLPRLSHRSGWLERIISLLLLTLQPRTPDAAASVQRDVNHGPGLLAVAWVEASLGLVVLLSRLYTSVTKVKKRWLDDLIMTFATVSVEYYTQYFHSETANLNLNSLICIRF